MIKVVTLDSPDNLNNTALEMPENYEQGIVLDIIACGICGTDGHLIAGKMPVNYPTIPGHEFYGTVSYIGKDSHVKSRNGEIKLGDVVTVLPGKSCGNCQYCTRLNEQEELCINRKTYGLSFSVNDNPVLGGGYAEKAFITNGFCVYHIPTSWPLGYGAILETVAVGVHAAERVCEVATSLNDRNLTATIIGGGAVGFSVAQALINRGVTVSVIDHHEHRRKLAMSTGAAWTFSEAEKTEEWESVFIERSGGLKPDIVVEAGGTIEAFSRALELVRKGGVVLELGNFANIGVVPISPSLICRNEITVLGSVLAPEKAYPEAEKILNSLIPFSDEIISPVFSLVDVSEAIENLRGAKKGLKAILIPRVKGEKDENGKY